MLVRLGNVVYWAASIIAVLLAGLALYGMLVTPSARSEPVLYIFVMGVAAIVYAVGWAVRYVLVGK